jgi:UDP-2-acetamido-3-amino-2,3-dideoxy-glucuronate N-acetyltransferase
MLKNTKNWRNILDTKIAVIGCGLWGRNLVRNFHNLGVLYAGCDLDSETLKIASKEYPEVFFTNNIDEIFNNKKIDAVVIATPSHTHYNLVKRALESGKHVYVEKPIATCAEEAKELNEFAEEKECVLMVGHLLMYHPAVNRLKTLIEDGVLGDIDYIQSDRLNINFYKNDRSVMWDLAPHDLSMISYIIDKSPLQVKSAVGASTEHNEVMDIVHVDIEFPDNIHAHISNSWIHPLKRVVLLVRGSKATAILDDAETVNKLQLYDNFSQTKRLIDYPEYLEIEPLKLECQHFISCIKNKMKPRSDGTNGYNVVKVLEEAEKIMLGKQYNKVQSLKFASSRKKNIRTSEKPIQEGSTIVSQISRLTTEELNK